jgi:hypothetical protein
MNEQNFDVLLRRALMDANLERFRAVLDEGTNPTFSPRYLRTKTRILTDPFGWLKKASRPSWKKVLRSAACILLACTLAFGALLAASPTVRAAVLNWLREINGREVSYHSTSESALETPPSWRPSWLPEGMVMTDIFADEDAYSWWEYYADGDDGREDLTCACFDPSSGGTGTILGVSDANSVRTTTTIQGRTADYYESDASRLLVWEDQDGRLFWLRSDLDIDQATLEKVAESMTFYDDAETSYEIDWLPEEYTEFQRYETNGVVQEEWLGFGEILTWQYVTDPLCPGELPERESETVEINGLSAQYWVSEVPEDYNVTADVTVEGENITDEGNGVYSADGATVTFGTIYGTEKSGVLVWTDPETNTTFRLKGNLGRDDLLRMAESVTEKK